MRKAVYFSDEQFIQDPQAYVRKLSKMGLTVGEDRIVTSGQASIAYLKSIIRGSGSICLEMSF